MSSLTDHRWCINREATYGTSLLTTPRFFPWLETDGSWDNRRRTSQGLQGGGGRRTVLGNRTFLPKGIGSVKTKVELEDKGLGYLLDIALGVSTVTAVTGGSQQNFHTGITSGFLPSATIQIVKVQNDGTEVVETYTGCTASKLTFEQPEEDIATVEIEWDALAITTATAAASVTYASGPTPFDASMGSVFLGGTYTAPTTTTLAVVSTSFADFKSWKFEVDQNLDVERWVIGNRNRPIAGVPKYSFDGTAEFNGSTIPSRVLDGARFPWAQTWTAGTALGAGFTQLQLSIPSMALTGDLPKVKFGETVTVGAKGMVFNDGTNRDFNLCYRTTDTAL